LRALPRGVLWRGLPQGDGVLQNPGLMVWPTTFSTPCSFLLSVRPEQPVTPAEGAAPLPHAARFAFATLCRLLRRPAPSVPPSSACSTGRAPPAGRRTPPEPALGPRAARRWVCRPQRPRLGSWAAWRETWPRERDMASRSG
jgi:hypothetical protein